MSGAILILIIFLVLVTGWIAIPRRVLDSEVDDLWGRVAQALGLEYDGGGPTSGPTMHGKMGKMKVLVDTFGRLQHGQRMAFTRIIIDSDGRIREQLTLSTPDAQPKDPIEALLAQHSKARITDLVKHLGATVHAGRVRWATEGLLWGAADFVQTVRDVVRTTEHLCLDEADIPGRLLLCIRDHQIPEKQRREMLLVLLDRYPGTSEANTAARDAVAQPDGYIRLVAARALGQQGITTLGMLARDPEVTQEIRTEALKDLMTSWPSELGNPQVRRVLRSEEPPVVRTGIHMVRHLNHTPAVRIMLELAADPQTPPDMLSLLVEVIGEMGDEASEPVLLGLLNHDNVVVRRGSAIALGQLGTPNALESLREQSEDALMPDSRLLSLCRAARQDIRKRHGLPPPGLAV